MRHFLLLFVALCLSASSPAESPAQSAAQSPIVNKEIAVVVVDDGPFLDDVLVSTEFELIAEKLSSFNPVTDATTWFNVTSSPASGALKAAYDFLLGQNAAVEGDEPTLSGTAGVAGTKWTFDGGDFFHPVTGVNTQFLKDLHKTTGGQDWWAAFVLNHANTTWGGQAIWSTVVGTTGPGWVNRLNNIERYRAQQFSATSGPQFNHPVAGGLSAGDHIVIWSFTHATDTMRMWVDSSTGVDDQQNLNVTTADPDIIRIGSFAGGTVQALTSDTDMYWIATGNENLDDTKAAIICTYVEALLDKDLCV